MTKRAKTNAAARPAAYQQATAGAASTSLETKATVTTVTPVTLPPDPLKAMADAELKTYIKGKLDEGQKVLDETKAALKEMRSRCKDQKIWQQTLLEFGIKPGTWRQWAFKDLNEKVTGKRSGKRNTGKLQSGNTTVPPATFPDPKVETPKAILTSAHKELGAAAATGSALAKEIITKNEDELREAKAAAAAPAPSAPVVVDADYDEPVTYSRITKLADLNIQTDSKQSQDLINQPDSLRFDAMLELARETKEIKTIPIVDVEPDVTKDPDETSSPEEETEENALPQYRVRLVVEGKRLTSVKKQLRTMFPALSPDDIEVEKIDGRASRMDRLCEAISLVNDAKETVDELAQELQEWHDNLPGNLQSGEKASELEEAINSLESLSSELENINWDVEFPSMM